MLAKVTRLSELDPSILEGFACGDEWMDDWLTRKAPLQLSRNLCVMHVGLDEDGRAVGFFTLSNCQVEPSGVSRKERHGISRTPFGAYLIGEIAVRSDLRHSDYGYGVRLLFHAVKLACDLSKDAGASFIVVDPRDGNEHLCGWYQRNGFKCAPEGYRHYLPIKVARERIAEFEDEYFVFG